jgi:hypothetical protein
MSVTRAASKSAPRIMVYGFGTAAGKSVIRSRRAISTEMAQNTTSVTICETRNFCFGGSGRVATALADFQARYGRNTPKNPRW